MTAAVRGARTLRGPALFGGACAAVLLGSRLVLAEAAHADILELAVTLDLTVLIPFAFWVTLARPRGWPAATLLPVFVLCVLGAGQVLPPDRQRVLDAVRGLAVLAELALVAFVVRRVASAFRDAPHDAGTDPVARIHAVTRTMLGPGRAAGVVAFETSVLWFALLSWRRGGAEAAPGTFTHHRRASYGAVVGVVLLAIAVETLPVHLLLARLHDGLAWAATALSLYGALWLIGDWRATRQRATTLGHDTLRVRFGLRWRMDVPRATVVEAVAIGDMEETNADVVAALPGAQRVWIALDRPVEACGPYGTRRVVRTLVLGVDDAARLIADLTGEDVSD